MNLGNKGSGRGSLAMDMTPLLDVVFLLLIFFVLTTTFVSNPGIEVDLPKAASGETLPPDDSIIIVISGSGEYVHEGETLTPDQLEDKFRGYQASKPGAAVVIQADHTAQHGNVIRVLDIARKFGFNKLALATEEE